jgi:hypothetical protein
MAQRIEGKLTNNQHGRRRPPLSSDKNDKCGIADIAVLASRI